MGTEERSLRPQRLSLFIPIDQPFDLESTLHSGQAFRWRWDGGWHHGVVFSNVVRLRQAEGGLELSCEPDDEAALWPLLEDYLGLDVDLARVYSALGVDSRLCDAIVRYHGMRVLRQDPWECLVSFICSSASNIPRITRNIESICQAYGRPVGTGAAMRNAFPTPDRLSRAGEAPLRALGLGYRGAYIAETAGAVAGGAIDLMSLREEPYELALETLTDLAGVGDKVANCVLLFSLDKPEAFPVDTHIAKAVRETNMDADGLAMTNTQQIRVWAQGHFGPYAGYANHYLFHSRRMAARP